MSIVGAKPVLTATTTSNAGLTQSADTHLFDVTVTPSADLTLKTLTFSVVASATTGGINLAGTRLTDSNGTTLTDFTCATNGASIATAADFTCTASAGYLLSSAKTFSFYGTPTFATFGAAGTSSITTKMEQTLGTAQLAWADTTGGGALTDADGAGFFTASNATYMYAYPTATWSIHN
jgi:hypothetical protein